MTDSTPTPSTPEPAATPAAPAYAAAPVVAGPVQTLSIVGFILGIASVVFGWTFFIGLGAGIAAVIVSNKAKKQEPASPAWMKTVGLITGIVGIVLVVIFGVIWLLSVLLPLILIGSAGSVYNSY